MGASFKKIGLIAKQGNPEAVTMAKGLLPVFQKYDCEVFLPKDIFSDVDLKGVGTFVSEDTLASSIDLLIALGGDGTLLKSVRLLEGRQVPVVGVKLGTVGFLTEIPKEDAQTGIEEILKGNFALEERLKVEAKVIRNGKEIATFQALNDVVVHTSGVARVSHFKVTLNTQTFMNIRADGLLVASPTGSTAYSLAAGGPLIEPRTNVMVLTPICSQSTVFRPMVVSDKTEIEIEMSKKNSDVLLTADGQQDFPLEEGDRVVIRRSPNNAYLLKTSQSNYLKTLKNKLFLDS